MRGALVVAVVVLVATAMADEPKRKRPSRDAIARALDKHLAEPQPMQAHKHAKRLLTPETCKVKSSSKTAVVMTCRKRGCGDACEAIEAKCELRFRANGATSLHKLVVDHHGETGECGHCAYAD